MISFRYHVVTLVSVFLALAVGVALGGGPLKGEEDTTLVDQVASDRQVKDQLQSEIASLRSGDKFADDFAAVVAPGMVANTLRGRVVAVVVLPTARQADVAGLKSLIGVAGGSVGGTVRVGSRLVDAEDRQLVEELGKQLQPRARGVNIPADAGPYDRMGSLVARAIGTRTRGGSAVDPPATTILAGLSATSLMSAEGRLSRRGDLVLFVTGPGEGGPDEMRGASTIVTSLVLAVDRGTAGTVLAGPVAATRAGGQVKAVRDDVGAARDVSTVDVLDRTAGQVVTVMALAGQAAGKAGHYGAVDAADGAMPGARSGE